MRSTADISKSCCCDVVEILHLKDSMWLLHKLPYFMWKQDSRMQMHIKSVGFTDTVLFLTIGTAGDELSPNIVKSDIYRRKSR